MTRHPHFFVGWFFTLKIEAILRFEMSVHISSTQWYIPDDTITTAARTTSRRKILKLPEATNSVVWCSISQVRCFSMSGRLLLREENRTSCRSVWRTGQRCGNSRWHLPSEKLISSFIPAASTRAVSADTSRGPGFDSLHYPFLISSGPRVGSHSFSWG
jgi:hypothetical protein